jgi:hypothetical protein
MSDAAGRHPRAREAWELAALVIGREPPETVARLRSAAERLAAGDEPDPADLAVEVGGRERYGHELAELERPEPW